MLSTLRTYRKKAEKRKKQKATVAPHVAIAHFERRGHKWTEHHCSECDGVLHKTARFCVHCGAWFGKARK